MASGITEHLGVCFGDGYLIKAASYYLLICIVVLCYGTGINMPLAHARGEMPVSARRLFEKLQAARSGGTLEQLCPPD